MRTFRKCVVYAICFGMFVGMFSSCGGSQKSASIKQIERQSRKNPPPHELESYVEKSTSKKAKKALKHQAKLEKEREKQDKKDHEEGYKRHREIQEQETRDRMEQNLKKSDKSYSNKKECFLVRWFRPKTETEKILAEQAKKDQKSMEASRKKSEKTNKELGLTYTQKDEERKVKKADPKDMGQEGYKEKGNNRNVKKTKSKDRMPEGYKDGKSKTVKKSKPKDRMPEGYKDGKNKKGKAKKKNKR